jgi:putative sterol carrier protein
VSPQNQSPTKSPSLSRFAVLRKLTSPGKESPDDTLKKLAELLAGFKLHGTLHLRLVDGGKVEDCPRRSVTFGSARAKRGSKAAAAATVEWITTSGVWNEIASGQLAPHDAFLGGRMRVRGSTALAQRIVQHAAGSGGITHLCEVEEKSS